jgi:hypothetical protein
MSVALYFPRDEFDSGRANFDLSADYLELTAFFATDNLALTKDLVNASEIGAEEDYADVDEEMTTREEIVSGTVTRISHRIQALGSSYPFSLDENGDVLIFSGQALTYGQAAYLLCLVLSHLKAVSPVLDGTPVYPTAAEERSMRLYFQYFATAALAAEVRGRAWSFGHPRPDRSNFKAKLEEIWRIFKDGQVEPGEDAPKSPQDDQVDVFAARLHPDGLPGFLLAAAQVATGDNWDKKSIRGHLNHVFCQRWFGRQPATPMVCYHIIPFSRPDNTFSDDVRQFGNVLHRLRVPYRVQEATELAAQGIAIEAFDRLPEAIEWLKAYGQRAQEVA